MWSEYLPIQWMLWHTHTHNSSRNYFFTFRCLPFALSFSTFDFGCELMCFCVAFIQTMCHGSNCNYAAIKSGFWANKMCTRYLRTFTIHHSHQINPKNDLPYNLCIALKFEILWFNVRMNRILLLLLPVVPIQFTGSIFDATNSHFGNETFIWYMLRPTY